MTPLNTVISFVQQNYLSILLAVLVIYSLYLRFRLMVANQTIVVLDRGIREIRKEVVCLRADIASRR